MKDKKDKTLAIYVATHGPKCLHLQKSWTPIELNAANRNTFIYPIRDNIGEDNISVKNPVYCENTGLYWMWKNDQHDLVGMCHYRRYMNLSDRKIKKILKYEGYDIICSRGMLDVSMYSHYCLSHVKSDIDIAIDIINKLYPDYTPSLNTYLSDNIALFCNIFVTRRDLFHRYCEWVFPIFEELEKKVDISRRDDYQKRYVGFLSERLATIFILHNKLRIYELDYYTVGSKHPMLSYFGKKMYYSYIEKIPGYEKIIPLCKKINNTFK